MTTCACCSRCLPPMQIASDGSLKFTSAAGDGCENSFLIKLANYHTHARTLILETLEYIVKKLEQ